MHQAKCMSSACSTRVYSNMVVHEPQVSQPSKRLSPVVIKILVAGISIFILLLLIVLAVVLIRRRRANKTHPLRTPLTPSLPLQTPPGISPREPKSQSSFYNHSDLEKGVKSPVSVVRPAPDDNPFADDVMQDSRDDRWADEGSVVRLSD